MAKKNISLTILFLCLALTAWADGITITVRSPKEVEAGSQFKVSFVVNTHNVSNFTFPDFKGFEVIYGPAKSVSSSVQIINGHRTESSSITYSFSLIATKPGTYTIGPASADDGRKKVQSQPYRVKVVDVGNLSPQAMAPTLNQGRQAQSNSVSSQDVFMTATLSKTHVYEQEAVLLTYKVYTLVDLRRLDGDVPTLNGFQIQEVPLPNVKTASVETYHGRNYYTYVWSKYLLFPQKTGKLTIPSIRYEGIVVRPNMSLDPTEIFFNGPLGMNKMSTVIQTPPVNIQVSALPEKPDDFSHAVGTFAITSSMTPKQVDANDAVSLKVVVKGQGNMNLISTPELKLPDNFEAYDPKVNDNFRLTEDGLSGAKTFEYTFIPRHPGNYTIPPIEFTYFDVNEKAYKTLTTESYNLQVAKGHGVDVSANNQQEVKKLADDIRYIKSGDATEDAPMSAWKYLLCYLIPLALFAIAMLLMRRKRNRSELPHGGKSANKVAKKRLKHAAALMQQHQDDAFYEETLKALYGYAADKCSIPLGSLTKDNIQNTLLERGVPQELTDKYLAVLDHCEFARYAPQASGLNPEAIYHEAVTAIGEIEKIK